MPPSKSIANRALICAALAEGTSEVIGVAPGDDTASMITCLQQLGCGVGIRVDDDERTADVIGTGGDLTPGPMTLDAGLAGTTSRFVTALAALGTGEYTIDGAPPLRRRPMGPLHDSLTALGASVVPGETAGHLPVTIAGPLRRADAVVMPGDVSSQYITAMMLIAPYVPGGLKLWLSSGLVSRPYLEMTRSVMGAFGHSDVELRDRHVIVGPGEYLATDFRVEPDASSASYPLAAAAMVGGAVSVRGLGSESVQGDVRFVEILESMGCLVTMSAHDTVVMRRRDTPLRGVEVDMADISDLVPTLAVVATQAVDAHADHRCRLHPRQGERSPRRPRRRTPNHRGADHRRARRAADRADRPPARRPTPHPSRPSPRHGVRSVGPRRRRHRDRRPGSGVEELAELLGCARRDPGATPVTRRRIDPAIERVAAFDVDGTLTRRDCVVPFLRRVAGTRLLTQGMIRQSGAVTGQPLVVTEMR